MIQAMISCSCFPWFSCQTWNGDQSFGILHGMWDGLLRWFAYPGIVVHSQRDFGRLPWKISFTNPPRDRGSDLRESLLPWTDASELCFTVLWYLNLKPFYGCNLRIASVGRSSRISFMVDFCCYLSSKRSEQRRYGWGSKHGYNQEKPAAAVLWL